MTIELSVKDVRSALQRAGGGAAAGDGEAATLLLGRLFHETFAEATSDDPARSCLPIIAEGQGNQPRRFEQLEAHLWTKVFAPKVLANAATLQPASTEVLMTWRAVKNLAHWLDAVVTGLLDSNEKLQESWERVVGLFRSEVHLTCELHQPGWTESVRLVGIADSILRVPGRKDHCAIELKLGRATPVVDMGQVVLYHLILSRSGSEREAAPAGSALSLLRFSPELDERLVLAKDVAEAELRLIELIGELAGVVAKQVTVPPPSMTQPPPAPDLEDLGVRIKRACREHGVGIEFRSAAECGPRFIRFDLRLTPGGRISNLRGRTREIQHRLEFGREPMVVEDAGHVYLDVERRDPKTVLFSTVLEQLAQLDPLRGCARVPIGVDSAGELHFADLASSGRSHILVAGSTGSGKSEWLRTALAGLIATNTPDTLRLVTLDPKLAAFNDLEHSKYLWKPNAWWIQGGETQASELFQDLIEEMDRRYRLVRSLGVDNLAEYVVRSGKPLPRIVCVCDEYFSLIAQQKTEQQAIESAVSLLGAKGRAAGVHLVLATQQPSRRTITGAIQANLPCRVALWLQSAIESNMILGQAGAERLTGAGDLLYKDFGNPVRLQAPYLPEEERKKWLRQ
jgi:energy-coupling factor transporter ATP-binding protein EcfA2